MKSKLMAAGAVVLGLLGGCSSNPTKQEIGTATGAVVGGAAGAVLTGGSTWGTVGGAAVGGVIGNQVGKEMDKKRSSLSAKRDRAEVTS